MVTVGSPAQEHLLERLTEPRTAKALERIFERLKLVVFGWERPTVSCGGGRRWLTRLAKACAIYDGPRIRLQGIGGPEVAHRRTRRCCGLPAVNGGP